MNYETLYKLEGLQTIETIMQKLGITKQSALNLVSKLKKEQHLTTKSQGRHRLYKITMRKQLPRKQGMFDIINKHSPHMKLNEWYDHQVHGKYTEEDALIDAIQTKSFRAILASLHLFSHIKDWKRLYKLAKENDCWQQVGALYDLAKLHFKVRKMPEKYSFKTFKTWKQLTQLKNRNNYPEIQKKYKVTIPFNENDLKEAS